MSKFEIIAVVCTLVGFTIISQDIALKLGLSIALIGNFAWIGWALGLEKNRGIIFVNAVLGCAAISGIMG